MRLTIIQKMIIIGLLGLIGMMILGGIGYLSTEKIGFSATQTLKSNSEIRHSIVQSYERALHSEKTARQLNDLNRRLILLMDLVIKGPERNIPSDDLLRQAQQLVKDAEMIRTVPGHDRPIPGTKLTLADVTISNFDDIAATFEFELPDYYAAKDDPKEFKRLRGETITTLARMYTFISKNLAELAEKSLNEVGKAQTELAQVMKMADLETAATDQALAETRSNASISLLTVFSITVIIIGMAFFLFARAMAKPLQKTVEMANALKLGRVNARLEIGTRSDEYGDMARALNQFADELEHDVVKIMQQMSDGNFNISIQPSDDKDLIRNVLVQTVERLNSVMYEINNASDQVAINSDQVASSAQMLSEGASSSAASLQQISAAVNEMSSQVVSSAENATQANQLSTNARCMAESGNSKMQEMVTAMEEIRDSSQDISKIIKAIDEIAFQTNLLALNAAVEAARAGQHGKGFAVVAEEVRNLAARSAKAASETTELIQAAMVRTENGVVVANETADALKAIVTSITEASELTDSIALASRKQAEEIEQVNHGLTMIDKVIQGNTASSEESAATSEQLSSQARVLKELISQFQLRSAKPLSLHN